MTDPARSAIVLSALELFRLGCDTACIAEYWQITEAEALRRLNVERSNARRLPSPYGVAA
jgi:hypothetical protein